MRGRGLGRRGARGNHRATHATTTTRSTPHYIHAPPNRNQTTTTPPPPPPQIKWHSFQFLVEELLEELDELALAAGALLALLPYGV